MCVFVCHLCMNYNSALTEGEVGPFSWFDESVVRVYVCLCTAGVKRDKESRERAISRGHLCNLCFKMFHFNIKKKMNEQIAKRINGRNPC